MLSVELAGYRQYIQLCIICWCRESGDRIVQYCGTHVTVAERGRWQPWCRSREAITSATPSEPQVTILAGAGRVPSVAWWCDS